MSRDGQGAKLSGYYRYVRSMDDIGETNKRRAITFVREHESTVLELFARLVIPFSIFEFDFNLSKV